MSDSTIDALVQRLAQLEDERAIIQTLYTYTHNLDHGDREAFAACFTEDAVFTVQMRLTDPPIRGNRQIPMPKGFRVEGRNGMAEWFNSRRPHAPEKFLKHITVNPKVVLHGDTATVESYFIVAKPADPKEAGPAILGSSGRYIDEFVRDGDRWRIRLRHCEVENA
jgi:ketosteroid isomerase-like protein